MSNHTSVDLDRFVDPEFYVSDDFHPTCRLLRQENPVAWCEAGKMWLLTRYEDVRDVLRAVPQFTSTAGNLITVHGEENLPSFDGERLLIHLDPPSHSVLRKVAQPVYARNRVAALEGTLRKFVAAQLAKAGPTDVFDVVEELAKTVPVLVTDEILGIGEEAMDSVAYWADSIVGHDAVTNEDQRATGAAIRELMAFLKDHIAAERKHPKPDSLLGLLFEAERAGDVTPGQILSTSYLTLAASYETTRDLLAGGVAALAMFPDQRELLISEPELLGRGVEELLRWVSPPLGIVRRARESTRIGGVEIAEGDYVVALLGSANRDDSIWQDPDRVQLDRPSKVPNVAFGYGAHFCLGAHLARLEARIVISELLDRHPNYELAGPLVRLPSVTSYHAHSLPVILN
ncbi:cytochrome P450 [Mycobacterium sp. NPDC003449]